MKPTETTSDSQSKRLRRLLKNKM